MLWRDVWSQRQGRFAEVVQISDKPRVDFPLSPAYTMRWQTQSAEPGRNQWIRGSCFMLSTPERFPGYFPSQLAMARDTPHLVQPDPPSSAIPHSHASIPASRIASLPLDPPKRVFGEHDTPCSPIQSVLVFRRILALRAQGPPWYKLPLLGVFPMFASGRRADHACVRDEKQSILAERGAISISRNSRRA